MKNLLLTSLLVVGLAPGLFADTFTLSSINGGAPIGTPLVNFDNLVLGNAPQMAGAISLTFSDFGSARVVNGSVINEYAAPYLSGNNGVGFGNPGNQADGLDSTNYLSAGTGTITFQFSSGQNYLGLLWGSVDDYNSLAFYSGDTLLHTYNGIDVWAAANGDRGEEGTFYVNINNLDGVFDRVVAASTTNSFEIDNMAHSSRNSVPEGGATVALLGLSLVGLAMIRRKL